jgi:hypothetical protein
MSEKVIEFKRERIITERVEMPVSKFVEYCSEFRWVTEGEKDVIDVYAPDLVHRHMMYRVMTIRDVIKTKNNAYLTPEMVKEYLLKKDRHHA